MPGSGSEAASYGDLLITSLVVLAAVCVAAFVVVRFLGRFLATGRARGAHLLDVVARVPLEPRRSLYVVDVAGKTLLVGTSEMGLSVLSELDRGEVQSRVVEKPTFAELVRNAWAKRRGVREASSGGASGGVSGEALIGASVGASVEASVAASVEGAGGAPVAASVEGAGERLAADADAVPAVPAVPAPASTSTSAKSEPVKPEEPR